MKLPWVKWFPTDWLSDSELAKTSLLGRGLWAEALNAMYNSDTYALSGTPEELSRVLRCTVAEFHASLGALRCHKAANVMERNNIVTLVSRRLERQHKSRRDGSLRARRFREKQAHNADPPHGPSASVSVSASESGNSGDKSLREGEVDLPRGFPPTAAEAEVHAQFVGCPVLFAVTTWNKAMGRGGKDARECAITSFRHHLASEWAYHQERVAKESREKGYDTGKTLAQNLTSKTLRDTDATIRRLERMDHEARD